MFVVRNLAKTFPSFKLGPLHLVLRPGRSYGLLGPNGAGKSTFLNCIANQTKISSGSMTWFDSPVTWQSTFWKSKLTYIRETPQLYDELTCEQILTLSSRLYVNWDQDWAADSLKRFGLEPTQRVGTLSKGSKVKLGLVAAVAHDAKIVLLDEPTAGLDPSARDELHLMIEEMRMTRPEMILLLSSHLFEDMNQSANELIILKKGRIVFQSSFEDLKQAVLVRSPVGKYTSGSSQSLLSWVEGNNLWRVLPKSSSEAQMVTSCSDCFVQAAEQAVPLIYRGTQADAD